MLKPKIGIWMIGARGSVAVTTMVGWSALSRGLISRAGLVTELPEFADLQLQPWSNFVIGGHDIRLQPVWDAAQQLATRERAIPPELLAKCKRDLLKIERHLKPGTTINVGDRIADLAEPRMRKRRETAAQAVSRIQHDLRDFAERHQLTNLLVVNLASTEPPADESRVPKHWPQLEALLQAERSWPLGASSLYALAALDLGYPYINFTPSAGSTPQALRELARLRKTCHAGSDGKTGETLLKSVLAPMLAQRNLHVMSWVGHNIFGNLDGKVLDDPANKSSKLRSKDQLLSQILGYAPQTLVSIEYIQSLGEWKTAWDHIHFRGFLETPMTLQLIWQGCDSILAAPLVLDLVRLTQRAHEHGEVGALGFLASFFKSPLEAQEHDFSRQFALLLDWARRVQPRKITPVT
jgi:myo-inositol-1-phosphate synthase